MKKKQNNVHCTLYIKLGLIDQYSEKKKINHQISPIIKQYFEIFFMIYQLIFS